MAITGKGNADKELVADILRRILHIPEENMLPQLDATDGLAAALCHFYQTNRPSCEKAYKSWKDFINQHPSRVAGETAPHRSYSRHPKSDDTDAI